MLQSYSTCTGLLIDWSERKDQYNACVMSGLNVVHPYKDPNVLLASFESLTDMSMHNPCSKAKCMDYINWKWGREEYQFIAEEWKTVHQSYINTIC